MCSKSPPALTVYFDGEYPVCSREIALYCRQAGASSIAWVDAMTCPAADLGADLNRPEALARLYVRTVDGELTSGAQAFTTLWRHLPRTAFLGKMLSRRPLLAILEVGYRLLLVVRRSWRRPRP